MKHPAARRLVAGLGTALAVATAALVPTPAAAVVAGLSVEIGDVTVGAGSAGVSGRVSIYAAEPVSTRDLTFTFDTAGLTGIASFSQEAYGFTCDTTGTLTTCVYYQGFPVEFDQDGLSLFGVTLTPDANATLDDVGTLAYTMTADGVTASGTSRVTIGEGVDLSLGASEPLGFVGVPGTTLDIDLPVRNLGDATVHGAVLWLGLGSGLRLAKTFSNCHYQVGRDRNAYCEFDAELAPGAAYSVPLRIEVEPTVSVPDSVWGNVHWSTPTDWAEQRAPDREFTPGSGVELELEPVVSAARRAQTDIDTPNNYGYIIVHTTSGDPNDLADLAAIGATTEGPAGTVRTVRVGMRNEGPASIDYRGGGGLTAQLRVAIPEGTTVLSTDSSCWLADGFYVCGHPQSTFPAGTEVLYSFRLRIDRVVPSATARVSVNEYLCTKCDDGDMANDVAYLVVNG